MPKIVCPEKKACNLSRHIGTNETTAVLRAEDTYTVFFKLLKNFYLKLLSKHQKFTCLTKPDNLNTKAEKVLSVTCHCI